MDEQTIAQQLKQNIPTIQEPTAPTPTVSAPVGQAEVGMPLELDEMTVFKIHDFFSEAYKPTDEKNIERAKYIYNKIAEIAETTDYGMIIERMREFERIIGTTNSDQRMYKLYRWLKLDSMRRSIESQQNALRGY